MAVKRALHQLVLSRLLPAVDEHNGEVTRDEPALRALMQIRCHNSISLLLADYAESLNVAVDLLVQCEGEEVLLFVLHAGAGRRDLVVSPLCCVDIDIRARKRLQVIAEFHVELATRQRGIILSQLAGGPLRAVSGVFASPLLRR